MEEAEGAGFKKLNQPHEERNMCKTEEVKPEEAALIDKGVLCRNNSR